MFTIRLAAVLASVLTLSATDAVKPLPSLAEPAISPDRSEIAFVSGGDIWTVSSKGGEAHLLVSGPATESRPLYSPDGSKLAFTSTRTGNGDIYVLDFNSGALSRLTYSDSPDQIDAWSHDGNWIYFTSAANDIGGSTDIFRVSSQGGTPLEVTRERFYNEFRGAPSPDGAELAFVAKGFSVSQWWRHGHSHLDESEIWIKGTSQSAPYKRIVEEDAKQGWPMWSADGHGLFYTSDRSGAENVYYQPLEGGKTVTRQVTKFTDGRLLWPSIAYDGRQIVFERNFAIWLLDTKSGTAKQVPITLRGAPSAPETVHQVVTQFSDFALSPDGKKVAVIAHGDVFAGSASEGGEAVPVTHTPAPESDLRWSPDSNNIVYISARNGPTQIFEYNLIHNAETQLTSAAANDDHPLFSPDGKSLAFVRADHELHVLTLAGKADAILATGSLAQPVITWSPDGQFLAYTATGAKSFRNVNVVAVVGGAAAKPVSFLANGETASRIEWSPDGKYLLFDTAQRTEPSQIARVDFVAHLPKFREDQFRELFTDKTPLTQPDTAPSKPSQTPIASAPSETPSKPPAPSKHEPTQVVFEGIRERLSFMPIGLDCGPPVISPDGKTLLFSAEAANHVNLYSYSLDELSTEPPTAHQLTATATPKSHYAFTPDSKQIYFLDAGRIDSLTLATSVRKPVTMSAALDISFDQEKMAAFEQGWSLLDRRFFDPKFNGKDWTAIRAAYAPYIAGARTPDEMRRDMGLMIGELNASHSGIGAPSGTANPRNPSPPQAFPSPTAARVGRLGLRFEREPYESGQGLVIREVIPLGPAALEGTIKPGETLLAVDGEPVGPHTNLDALLQNKIEHRLELQIGSAAPSTTKRNAIVSPIPLAVETGLLYRFWVETNRAYVDRVSGGKLGYVHIADMSAQSLSQLYIDLDTANQTKQGVVIDLRDNHGGFVNGFALDVFSRQNYLTMTPRGEDPAPARPFLGQRALGLPTVLVINQGSLSDAEDFTQGYRSLKLGKVVGEPTAGWIIYTFNMPLIDGSIIRVPGIRVQTAAGAPMEMHPRPVDVAVERLAGESLNGTDKQLDAAVRELLSQ